MIDCPLRLTATGALLFLLNKSLGIPRAVPARQTTVHDDRTDGRFAASGRQRRRSNVVTPAGYSQSRTEFQSALRQPLANAAAAGG